jgi:hypothetical protein
MGIIKIRRTKMRIIKPIKKRNKKSKRKVAKFRIYKHKFIKFI